MADIIRNPGGQWVAGSGPAGDVALSARVRLARNLADVPFPPRMDERAAERVLDLAEQVLPGLSEVDGQGVAGRFEMFRLRALSLLERRVLVEKHLISPQHARDNRGAVILRDDEAVSIMINEEDHFRIQVLYPGLQVEESWALADRVDDILEGTLDFAFCPRRGYLTTCPTNTGTGMRASVMMHLPGLAMSRQAPRVFGALSKVGIVVRGLYGEGTEAAANIFQVSNQTTLGSSEQDIRANLQGVSQQIIDRERIARRTIYEEAKDHLEDRVWRAYGVLTTARSISSQEAMGRLSDLRLGVDLGVLPQVKPQVFNELLLQISPGFLQVAEGRELGPSERDLKRAQLIRERINQNEEWRRS